MFLGFLPCVNSRRGVETAASGEEGMRKKQRHEIATLSLAMTTRSSSLTLLAMTFAQNVTGIFCFLAMTFALSACGHFNSTINPDASSTPAVTVQATPSISNAIKATSIEDKVAALIHTNSFQGSLTLQMAPGKEITEAIRKVIAENNGVLGRASKDDFETVEKKKKELERLSGKTLTSWNDFYVIQALSAEDAEKIYRKLRGGSGVKSIVPEMKPGSPSISDVPDLSQLQGYAGPADSTGGLNAVAAWNRGIKGEKVTIVDQETDWNFYNQDYSLIMQEVSRGGSIWSADSTCQILDPNGADYRNFRCPQSMDHGTAVVGILGGLHDNHGINGFAPESKVTVAQGDWRSFGDLLSLTRADRSDNQLEPGSIYLLELQFPGVANTSGSCDGISVSQQQGCMPVEAWPQWFPAIQDAIAEGITVIEVSGNGSLNLNDPNLYDAGWHNLATEDAGAIMVASSEGIHRDKDVTSNCGNRVNTFAWGQGVVTTSYPGSPDLNWDASHGGPIPPNDDPNAYFTNQFGGTSAAGAMVAGSAALVQSYAKSVMGNMRYLRPEKLRQILVQSGVPATSDGGCNIGVQPRIDVAMNLVDQFWSDAKQVYPQMVSNAMLSEDRMASLRDYGVGLICKAHQPESSDSICPESFVWPAGDHIAKTFDFDGDSKADLVSWTETGWKIDLSSNGLGAWDVQLTVPRILSRWVWPVVEDYNSDGRADFAVWDKENGRWYITFTTNALLSGHAQWPGWNWVIAEPYRDQLNIDPKLSQYSRPVPGDYDADGWIDLALQTSDGKWRIDYGGPNRSNYGQFDLEAQYLSAGQLAEAPGWAYLPVYGKWLSVVSGDNHFWYAAGYKCPDLSNAHAGKMNIFFPDDLSGVVDVNTSLGDNSTIPLTGNFLNNVEDGFDIAAKFSGGTWDITTAFVSDRTSPQTNGLIPTLTQNEFGGGLECHPFAADFDGNGIDDLAVQCPDEFRVLLSETQTVQHYPLGYDTSTFTLPGKPYYGSVSYATTRRILDLQMRIHPNQPPIIPVDMISQSVCTLPWGNAGAPAECR